MYIIVYNLCYVSYVEFLLIINKINSTLEFFIGFTQLFINIERFINNNVREII